MNKELKLRHKIYRVQGIHRHWKIITSSQRSVDPTVHHATSGRQTRPSTVKSQIALERAAHKRVHPRIVDAQLKDLLNKVELIVILRRHLHEVSSRARVKEVLHCNGRSGKTVKAQK